MFHKYVDSIPLVAGGECGSQHFISSLLSILEDRARKAVIDSSLLLTESTIHGVLLALRQILTEVDHESKEFKNEFWLDIHESIIAAVEVSFGTSVAVVTSSSPEGYLPQSDIEISDISHDSYSQLVLNQAFHTIKEGSSLLCTIIKNSTMPETRGSLSFKQMLRASGLIRDLLFQSRHRGTFSAIYEIYEEICKILSGAERGFVNEIPGLWLEVNECALMDQELFSQISLAEFSHTRRSGGLPYGFLAILSNAPIKTRSILISDTVERLLVIARTPVDISVLDRLDLPQVHAINILSHLISTASFYHHFKGSSILEDTLFLALDGFTSPSYGLRNCALNLFAVVLNRLFAKNITGIEFAKSYPRIWSLVFRKLEEIAGDGTFLHPAMHPLLTIFASCIYQVLIHSSTLQV